MLREGRQRNSNIALEPVLLSHKLTAALSFTLHLQELHVLQGSAESLASFLKGAHSPAPPLLGTVGKIRKSLSTLAFKGCGFHSKDLQAPFIK